MTNSSSSKAVFVLKGCVLTVEKVHKIKKTFAQMKIL